MSIWLIRTRLTKARMVSLHTKHDKLHCIKDPSSSPLPVTKPFALFLCSALPFWLKVWLYTWLVNAIRKKRQHVSSKPRPKETLSSYVCSYASVIALKTWYRKPIGGRGTCGIPDKASLNHGKPADPQTCLCMWIQTR